MICGVSRQTSDGGSNPGGPRTFFAESGRRKDCPRASANCELPGKNRNLAALLTSSATSPTTRSPDHVPTVQDNKRIGAAPVYVKMCWFGAGGDRAVCNELS